MRYRNRQTADFIAPTALRLSFKRRHGCGARTVRWGAWEKDMAQQLASAEDQLKKKRTD